MKFVLAGLGNMAASWQLIQKAVPEAEALGFWGAVFPDHYMWGEDRGGNATLDTWVTLSNLAARTTKIHLGTQVTPLSFRPPGMLAKMVSTVDVISGGRALLGVGAGWSQTEFEGYSEWNEPKVRVDKVTEALSLVLDLWTESKPLNFNGKFYHAKDAVLLPKPVQKPHPPLLFGSQGKRMQRLTGRYANICLLQGDAYEETKRVVLEEAKRLGRQNEISFGTGMQGRPAKYDTKTWSDAAENARKKGCGYLMAGFPADTCIESMRDFAAKVMPSFA